MSSKESPRWGYSVDLWKAPGAHWDVGFHEVKGAPLGVSGAFQQVLYGFLEDSEMF